MYVANLGIQPISIEPESHQHSYTLDHTYLNTYVYAAQSFLLKFGLVGKQ